LSLLVVSAVVAQPGDDEEDPAMVARLKETIDLANQLIASKTDKIKGQGYLILGSALSRQGKRTEGLKEYTKGLKLVYPGIESDELAKLVAEHPAFQQPDAGGNDPILAERHFGEGYHLYWAKKYPEAEAQFKKAVALFDKDARYQYFLGLAQYQQKTKAKRDAAYFSWEQGARLETKAATNPFAVREINAALERVQGNERQLLNSYRYKAAEEAEAK
jgi:TolA-binding protein